MQKAIYLRMERGGNAGIAMACVETSYTAGKIEEAVSVNVLYDGAFRPVHEYRMQLRHAPRNRTVAALAKGSGARSGKR